MNTFDDTPIEKPDDDRFGVNAFSKSIATTFLQRDSPEGTVIAINGPWGSGKSSIVNLIRHHLSEAEKAAKIKVVDFKCWWFQGEEALILAFFQALYEGMKEEKGDIKSDELANIGAHLLNKSSAFVGAFANVVAPGSGGIAQNGLSLISDIIKADNSLDASYQKLRDALFGSDKRFLVVIDDLDRLAPDEALTVFRLVKTVGRLPNVMFLLAYDRAVIERAVEENFPAEGTHYLEKIVQAGFDIPPAPHAALQDQLLTFLNTLWEGEEEQDREYLETLLANLIMPEIKTPRDVIRITNMLGATWPSVKGEVYPTDFLALEVIRIKRPHLYKTLQRGKNWLTGYKSYEILMKPNAINQRFDDIILHDLKGDARDRTQRSISALFPDSRENPDELSLHHAMRQKQRRVSINAHFDTYFRLSLGAETISAREISAFIERCDDKTFITETLEKHAAEGDQGARLRALLHELAVNAGDIPSEKATDFFAAVLSFEKRLEKPSQEEKLRSVSNIDLETFQLLYAILMKQKDIKARTEMVIAAEKSAGLSFSKKIANYAIDHYCPQNNIPSEKRLCTKEGADVLKKSALDKIETVISGGSIFERTDWPPILELWDKFLGNTDNTKARAWLTTQFENKDALISLAGYMLDTDISDDHNKGLSNNNKSYRNDRLRHWIFKQEEIDALAQSVKELRDCSDLDPETHLLLSRFADAYDRNRAEIAQIENGGGSGA